MQLKPFTKMLRHAARRCLLESTKKTSKPFWLSRNASTKPSPYSSIIHRHFCSQTQFTVRRSEPELVGPRKPTPHELKPLSDIDDQYSLRYQIPVVHFYRNEPRMQGKDPARVIRDALAQALVSYYPFAGRLREGPGQKLSVDCTGEGILFVEADADVDLSHFGNPPRSSILYFDKLLYHVPASTGITSDDPLLYIQVTRLKCGGFILALRMNHTMSDAPGLLQFLTAVAEIARGARAPSVTPVWSRELLSARDPPRITCDHRQYDVMAGSSTLLVSSHSNIHYRSAFYGPGELPAVDMTHHSFFIGPSDLLAIRRSMPPDMLPVSTTFEVLTAFLWRCYTRALQLDPEDEVRLLCIVNARGRSILDLPVGYYGNAIATPAAVATAGELCHGSVKHVVELVKKAKEDVNEEYMRSLADAMVIKGRPLYVFTNSLMVSDLRRAGLADVDFGWGKAVYAGPAGSEVQGFTFLIPCTNQNGEEGISVPMCMPDQSMERFKSELNNVLVHQST